VEEAMRIEKGAILICRFTDPGWTVLLDRAAGVVTETGGLLSHAAVICREYGIPAVLGVPAATRRIPDGSTIAIDGTAGRVDLLTESRLFPGVCA
jgi:pyruvate,water dikinase